MQGTHPIDERFREALAHATAEPPPELGAAILGRVRSRRRRILLWRWSAFALLLGLCAATGAYWLLRGPVARPESQRAAAQQEPPSPPGEPTVVEDSGSPRTASLARTGLSRQQQGPMAAATGRTANEQPKAEKGRVNDQRPARPLKTRGAVPMKAPGPGHSAEWRPPASGPMKPSAIEPSQSASALAYAPANASTPPSAFDSGTKEATSTERNNLQRLATLMATAGPAKREPFRSAHDWAPGRRGAWWAGLSIAGQQSRYQWQSDAENLRRALSGAGRWNSGISLGLHAGRSWPSGWSVGAGLEADRQDQAYRFLDRRTEVRTDTMTQLVTLNAQVFATTVDTIHSYAAREANVEGAESRTRIRVPVEVAWHLGLGRWRMGPRVAVVAERAYVRSAASLDLEPATGMVRSRPLAPEELEARYPLSIQGLLGLDLGYCASDRARLILSPFTTRHLTAIGTASTAQASPERFGVRLLLQHRF